MQIQEAQRVPNKIDVKKPTPRHIIINMPKFKDKERILKATRERKLVTYRGVPIRLLRDFSEETLQARRDGSKYSSHEKQGTTAKIALPSKAIVQNERADKELPRQEKNKGVHHHQIII